MVIPIVIINETGKLIPEVSNFVNSTGQPIVLHSEKPIVRHPEPDKSKAINIAIARTAALRKAESYDCSHFFFLDSDVVPPSGAIERLLEKNLPVVGGWFPARKGRWVGGEWAEPGLIFRHFNEPRPGLTKTDLISLGCVLVRRDLVKAHVFGTAVNHMIMDTYGNVFHGADSGAFSGYIQSKGIQIYLDGDVICQHLVS